MVNGRGVLVWNNGNHYDENWENRVPKGLGVFTWLDSTCYIGFQSKDSWKNYYGNQILNGIFYRIHNSNRSNRMNETANEWDLKTMQHQQLLTFPLNNLNIIMS